MLIDLENWLIGSQLIKKLNLWRKSVDNNSWLMKKVDWQRKSIDEEIFHHGAKQTNLQIESASCYFDWKEY